MNPNNMSTIMSTSRPSKRPLSPDIPSEALPAAKRRATPGKLQVDCTIAPRGPAPQLLHVSATSPFRFTSTTYSNTVDYGAGSYPCIPGWDPDWGQPANNIGYGQEASFMEACRTSIVSASSYSAPSIFSSLSSSQNPFVDPSRIQPQAFPPSKTGDRMKSLVVMLKEMQRVLGNVLKEVEEVVRTP